MLKKHHIVNYFNEILFDTLSTREIHPWKTYKWLYHWCGLNRKKLIEEHKRMKDPERIHDIPFYINILTLLIQSKSLWLGVTPFDAVRILKGRIGHYIIRPSSRKPLHISVSFVHVVDNIARTCHQRISVENGINENASTDTIGPDTLYLFKNTIDEFGIIVKTKSDDGIDYGSEYVTRNFQNKFLIS